MSKQTSVACWPSLVPGCSTPYCTLLPFAWPHLTYDLVRPEYSVITRIWLSKQTSVACWPSLVPGCSTPYCTLLPFAWPHLTYDLADTRIFCYNEYCYKEIWLSKQTSVACWPSLVPGCSTPYCTLLPFTWPHLTYDLADTRIFCYNEYCYKEIWLSKQTSVACWPSLVPGCSTPYCTLLPFTWPHLTYDLADTRIFCYNEYCYKEIWLSKQTSVACWPSLVPGCSTPYCTLLPFAWPHLASCTDQQWPCELQKDQPHSHSDDLLLPSLAPPVKLKQDCCKTYSDEESPQWLSDGNPSEHKTDQSIDWPVYLSDLSIFLSTDLSTVSELSIDLSDLSTIYLSIYLSNLCVCLSVYLSIFLPTYQIYLSVCLYIYQYILTESIHTSYNYPPIHLLAYKYF